MEYNLSPAPTASRLGYGVLPLLRQSWDESSSSTFAAGPTYRRTYTCLRLNLLSEPLCIMTACHALACPHTHRKWSTTRLLQSRLWYGHPCPSSLLPPLLPPGSPISWRLPLCISCHQAWLWWMTCIGISCTSIRFSSPRFTSLFAARVFQLGIHVFCLLPPCSSYLPPFSFPPRPWPCSPSLHWL